jgi:hypothetical protein
VGKQKQDNYLIIPDLHFPFEHPLALSFCKSVQKDFNIPEENVYSLGDLEDNYNFGRWPKDPDRKHTAVQELEAVRKTIRKWAYAFPLLHVCESNHGVRLYKKAFDAELPSQIIRSIEEVFEYPKDWKIKEHFVVFASKHTFALQHGDNYSGPMGHRQAAIDNGMSTIIGHLHSNAGVNFIETKHQRIFAVNSGCLIDPSAYAFAYGKHSRGKPCLGVTVVLDGGRFPIWVPLEIKEP